MPLTGCYVDFDLWVSRKMGWYRKNIFRSLPWLHEARPFWGGSGGYSLRALAKLQNFTKIETIIFNSYGKLCKIIKILHCLHVAVPILSKSNGNLKIDRNVLVLEGSPRKLWTIIVGTFVKLSFHGGARNSFEGSRVGRPLQGVRGLQPISASPMAEKIRKLYIIFQKKTVNFYENVAKLLKCYHFFYYIFWALSK